ncbi:MAG TPA: TonB family protein [Candidatus Sulfopaludibacter sp.]|nr:TonB family protein [Candidatus Sulfopaludibacter sp.]
MKIAAADQTSYELKDELARLCLATSRREPERKLAWANSVCLLFLLIGIFGARQGVIAIKPVPPLRQEIPVVVQPAVLPPQTVAPKPEQSQPINQPHVLVVLPNAPNVNFGVPSAGTLITDAALASAPQAAQARVNSLTNTGAGGERPEPPYPPIAEQTGEQGTVVLLLSGDDAGNVISVDVKASSGFPLLDRATVDFVKRHWRLPTDAGTRLFQTSITYKLQLN